MSRVLVLAEPGGTHEGDYAAMVRLIQTAAQCGADCLKAQWVSDPDAMCARRHITPDHPKYSYYRRAYGFLNFPVEWHADFSRLCKEAGIAYACTAFLPGDVATIAPHVDYLKIASFEVGAEDIWRAVVPVLKNGGHVIASTGMAESWYPRCGGWDARWHIHWLHCVSSYPAPLAEMNLAVLRDRAWGEESGEPSPFDGLSDHSRDVDMGGFAVCAGAQIIEAHFRLYDCSPENPDYAVAFDPGEFTEYILKIRKAERALGDGVKRIQDSEREYLPYRVLNA